MLTSDYDSFTYACQCGANIQVECGMTLPHDHQRERIEVRNAGT